VPSDELIEVNKNLRCTKVPGSPKMIRGILNLRGLLMPVVDMGAYLNINDAKSEAQAAGEKMISQAKAAIESEKNAAMAELKNQVSSLSISIAEKVLREELSNKESQTKLVEKMLGDVKLN
jgi:chemotaxis signal transduction protein